MTPPLRGSASWQHGVIEDAAAVSIATSTGQRVGFLSLTPQSGTSTVAALTTRIFAARRNGRVLIADTTQGGAGSRLSASVQVAPVLQDALARTALQHLGMRGPAWAVDLSATTLQSRPPEQAGLYGPAPVAGVGDWYRTVAPIARFFDVTSTDWGTRQSLSDISRIMSSTHTLCLVTPFDRSAGEHTISLARGLREQFPDTRIVLVCVDIERTRSTWPRLVAPTLEFPTIALEHDALLAKPRLAGAGRGARRQALRHTPATARIIRRLAAALMPPQAAVTPAEKSRNR